MSLPSRERGLKYTRPRRSKSLNKVAPLAGAWIEMSGLDNNIVYVKVAPLAGAWIEIISSGAVRI